MCTIVSCVNIADVTRMRLQKLRGKRPESQQKTNFAQLKQTNVFQNSRFNRKVCKNQKSINFAAWATAGFYPFVHKSYLPSFCEWTTRRDATRRERSSTRSNINLSKNLALLLNPILGSVLERKWNIVLTNFFPNQIQTFKLSHSPSL